MTTHIKKIFKNVLLVAFFSATTYLFLDITSLADDFVPAFKSLVIFYLVPLQLLYNVQRELSELRGNDGLNVRELERLDVIVGDKHLSIFYRIIFIVLGAAFSVLTSVLNGFGPEYSIFSVSLSLGFLIYSIFGIILAVFGFSEVRKFAWNLKKLHQERVERREYLDRLIKYGEEKPFSDDDSLKLKNQEFHSD